MTFRLQLSLLSISCALMLTACSKAPVTEPEHAENANKAAAVWPQLALPVAQDAAMEQRISDMLATMTLPQKVAQMIQPEIRDISVADMRKYGFGSYLNGGGAFPDN
ncbi:MAG TPA: glycoside hydrolase family 3 protein, partial [Rheinheimera sp.]|nr:glycoside hydrolase family 3 protein [Rheinheimera sp.]